MEDKLLFKQELKKALFEFEPKTKSGKKTIINGFKTTNNILTGIANKNPEIRSRYKVHKFLEKILIKKILNYVLFAYYRNEKMTIAVLHPVAQAELNFQKKMIMDYAKQVPDFKDIKEVTVFRFDKLNSFSKEFDKKAYNDFTIDNENSSDVGTLYEERSYGIFENKIEDKELHKTLEDIRGIIKNS